MENSDNKNNFEAPPYSEAAIKTPIGVPRQSPNPEPFTLASSERPLKKRVNYLFLGIILLFLLLIFFIFFILFYPKETIQRPLVSTSGEESKKEFQGIPSATVSTSPIDLPGRTPTIDCSNQPNTANYGNLCLPTIRDSKGNVYWAPETGL